MGATPSRADVLAMFESLTNWGRWGADDRLGTLNLVTDEVRLAATRTVREGRVVSMSRLLDPADPDPLGRGTVLQRYLYQQSGVGVGQAGEELRYSGFREFVGIVSHGSHTHLDGLAHIGWDGRYYNGFDATRTATVLGATDLSMHQAADGIVTRGVLLDLAALRGQSWLEPDDLVFPEDLEAAEERQGVRVGSGDALIVHTGTAARLTAERGAGSHREPGFSAACLPWLRERDVALLGADHHNDPVPSEYLEPELRLPVHCVGIVAMGLWILDNLDLGPLAAACAQRSRWEFLFTAAPWRMVGVTAAPVNPLAVL